MIPKLEWSALVAAATQLGKGEGLPPQLVAGMEEDEEFLQRLHHVLLEVHLVEGSLLCPETGRKFPVKDGIPNMLLNEDEV
jgi:multifunctional methyltransferase subunit TRM112